MKRVLLYVFCVFFIQSNIKAQCYRVEFNDIAWASQFSDLALYELRGPISKVITFSYKPLDSFGSITKGERVCHNEVLFNKDGLIQKIISFDENDKIDELTTYEYEDGRKKFETNYNSKGELFNKTVFIKEGQILREQLYIKDGSLNDQYYIYTYDEKGRIVKKERKYHENKLSLTPRIDYFSYDNYNRLSKVIDGRHQYTITYIDIYSKNPAKWIEFDTEKKKVTGEVILEYNNKGDLIKTIEDGKLKKYYEYTYDERDNWITRIEFETEAKIPESIVNRKIEYLK
jgi:hypothetical protein